MSLVARATGLSRPTIRAGLKELELSSKRRVVAAARVRAAGGGRRKLTETDPEMLAALERLIDPATRGDPMSPLRWTCKSTANLAAELTRQNHPVSDRTVAMFVDPKKTVDIDTAEDFELAELILERRLARERAHIGTGVAAE